VNAFFHSLQNNISRLVSSIGHSLAAASGRVRQAWSRHIWVGWRRWAVLAIALALVIGGVLAFRSLRASAQAAATDTSALQTATVRTGNLVLSASGSGTLIAGNSVELGFGTAGIVQAVNVKAGDVVAAGGTLAEQADRGSLEAAVVQAKLDLSTAKDALQTLKDEAPLALGQAQLALAEAQDALTSAQTSWQTQQKGYRASSTTLKAAEAKLTVAEDKVGVTKGKYDSTPSSDEEGKAQAYLNYAAAVQAYQSALASVNWYKGTPTETEETTLEANVAIAKANVMLAELKVARLENGADPNDLAAAEFKVSKAESDLAQAQSDLDAAVVVAPFAGTIMEVRAGVGDSVNSAFITLADLSTLMLDTYFDESDLDKVVVGNEVEVIFDALPDLTFTGHLQRVDPSLTQSMNSSLLHAVAVLDGENPQDLSKMPTGLNASVDVIAGRAENALLVPIEALREIDTDTYAVFVVQADGSLKLQPVEVGLQDLTWAEIKSGLQAGEVVSTGLVETSQ
jgi:RND family efflux transporter MFP subunit